MNRKTSIALALVVLVAAVLLWVPREEAQTPLPVTEPAVHPADARPSFDRNHFQLSAQSIARGDLLACRNLTATITQPGNATVAGFATRLNGVWLNENRRSVHGMPVWTDAAFYLQMNGSSGVGVLIDRNNLGAHVLAAPFRSGAYASSTVAQKASMKQVNCTYEFMDEFVKVSDQAPVQALAQSTGVAYRAGMSLVEVWQTMVRNGYFNQFQMPLTNDLVGPTQLLNPQLGDGTRVAVVADGSLVTEAQIAAGLVPGAEYELPMLTGGLFRITLAPVSGRATSAVKMTWEAEYRGLGIGLEVGVPAYGIEDGEFVVEGDAYVSARNMYGTGDIRAAEADADAGWETSECPEKNGLVGPEFAETVSQITTADGVKHTVTINTALAFERFVIGAPGASVVGATQRPEPTAVTAAKAKGSEK